MLAEASQQMVVEREQGDTVASIAQRHGVSEGRVYQVRKAAREFVTSCYMDLLVARKMNEICGLVIPYSDDYLNAVAYAEWLVAALRDLGLQLRADTRKAANGLILTLEDVTPIGASAQKEKSE